MKSYAKQIIQKYIDKGIIKDNTESDWKYVRNFVITFILVCGLIFAMVFSVYIFI